MSNAAGDRSVSQALQSHNVGSVFSAEEWLQILSEMEDSVYVLPLSKLVQSKQNKKGPLGIS